MPTEFVGNDGIHPAVVANVWRHVAEVMGLIGAETLQEVMDQMRQVAIACAIRKKGLAIDVFVHERDGYLYFGTMPLATMVRHPEVITHITQSEAEIAEMERPIKNQEARQPRSN